MKRRHTMALLLVVSAGVLACGCSKPWVRPYEWTDQQQALRTLAARTESVKSVQAACGLTLSDAAGESVNFDGAIVVRMDEQGVVWLRLRTWKFSHAVFDVTVRPDGTWLLASDEATQRQPDGLTGVTDRDLSIAWMLMMGRFFSDPGAKVIDHGAPEFSVEHVKDGILYRATVDRLTLTVSKYEVVADGCTQQILTLSEYREVGPDATPWPMTIRAAGAEGIIEVRLEDVEINGQIAENAFTPPRRAVKQEQGQADQPRRSLDQS